MNKVKDNQQILPCPFCGGTNIKLYSQENASLHGFIHLCAIGDDAMVKVESRLFKTEQDAINAWNRRVSYYD